MTKTMDNIPRLKLLYRNEINSSLCSQLGYSNPMQAPRLEKVVLNMGLGDAVSDSKVIASASDDLSRISGQKPVVCMARKSVAGFKLREGMPIGVRATLRSNRMYEFIDRLINISLPSIRDFRGLNPRSFDGRGNYSFGIREQIVFPEINYDKVDKVRGFDITICTSATDDAAARALLESLNFPFRK